jgi:hypothetical protein
MDEGRVPRCLQMKMSKRTRIVGARRRSVDKNSGRLHVNGSGTSGSRLGRACKKLHCARLSGHPRKRPFLRFSPLKSQLRSMGRWRVGCSIWTSYWALWGRCLHVTRGWQAPLSSGSEPVVERNASRECLYPTRRLVFPTKPTVNVVLFGSSVWRKVPKEIVRAVSVQSVASCLRPHRLNVSESQSFSDRCDGWMWQAEHFVAPGLPIGVVNTPRLSRLSSAPREFSLHHVPLVQYVHITAGVGQTGSPVMLGGDLRNCVSRWQASPPFSPATNTGGTDKPRSFFYAVSSSL